MNNSAFTAGQVIKVKKKEINNLLAILSSGSFNNSHLLRIYTVLGAAGDFTDYVGSPYTSAPDVSITGDGTGAEATAVVANGLLTEVNITEPGEGYSYAEIEFSGGGGSGAAALASLSGDTVVSATVLNESLVARLKAKSIDLDADFLAL